MSTLQNKYNELEEKLSRIIIRISENQQIINNIKNENQNLTEESEAARQELEMWKNKHRALAMSQKILNKEDNNELKKEINELVREIDFCIGYINGK